jgi:glyoxylate/hydroxypyruvate reductase A
MAMRLYVITPLDETGKARLLKEAKSYEVWFHREINEDLRESSFRESDIVFGNPPPDWLAGASRLKWVQLSSAGLEPYQQVRTPAIITNLKGFYSWPCAETAIAGIMGLYRKIDAVTILKQSRRWIGEPLRNEMSLLRNRNVLILGTGNIAKVCAQILGAFECEICFFARTAPEAKLRTAQEVERYVPQADVVINCLPGTAETRGFFNAAMISSMKPTAVFVNVGRGATVDEPALVRALQQNKIGGAVLDVHWSEPLPKDHPLWDCENTILTQHSGGGTREEYAGRLEVFLSNLKRFESGLPLENVVDPAKGY